MVVVTKAVAEGLEAVRQEGMFNMFDRPNVANRLWELGYYEASDWVDDNKKTYGRLIFEGLEIGDESETDD